MSETYIFLDVDGVLLAVSPMMMGGGDLDDSCIAKLKQIVDLCGAGGYKIVLSSTWRHDEEKKKRLNAALKKQGINEIVGGLSNGVPHPTDQTTLKYLKKDLDERKLVCERVDEISYYLETTCGLTAKDADGVIVGRWFAIDDMNLGHDGRMKGHFLLTDIEEGLTSGDVGKAKTLIDALPAAEVKPVEPAAAAAPAASNKPSKTMSWAAAVSGENSPDKVAAAAEQAPHDAKAHREHVCQYPVAPGISPTGAKGQVVMDSATGAPKVFHGTVKRYNPHRGFGFIACDGKEDVFVHQTAIVMGGFRGLNVGAPVEFTMINREAACPEAQNVKQLDPYVPSSHQRQLMVPVIDPATGTILMPMMPSGPPGGGIGFGSYQLQQRRQHHERPHTAAADGSVAEQQRDEQQQQPSKRGTSNSRKAARHGRSGRGSFSSNNQAMMMYAAAAGGVYGGGGRRGGAFVGPLIPEGYGFRSQTGTMFYVLAPAPTLTVMPPGYNYPTPTVDGAAGAVPTATPPAQ